MATAGLAPTISLCRNVGGSSFLPGILATVSNVREVANVFLLGVAGILGSGVVSLPLVPMGLLITTGNIYCLSEAET